jgi:peptide/nickel transport system substrate-binding protein
MTSIDRAALGVSAAAVVALGLTACGDPDRRDAARAQRGGTVVVVEAADMDKPMPLISESTLDNNLSSVLYRSLLEPSWEDGRLHYLTSEQHPMSLARSYEFFGPDSASIRYRMVSDARWSDGQPVTAHDVVWTITARGDERTASPRQDYNRQIRDVLAEDDSTVVIHFERRYPEIFFHTAGPPAPRHLYADHDLTQLRSHPAVVNPGGGNLVVSGPYMIGEWMRGQQVTLVPNPQFQPQPLLDRIVFRIITEPTTRVVELQTGNADFMYQLPVDRVEAVRRDPNLRIEAQEGRAYDFIGYNPRSLDFFADPEIRRALGLAIDKEGLIAAIQMVDFAIPAGGPYAPIFRELYDPREQAPLPFDPEQALEILARKGWRPGPDGILQREGRPFRFTLLTNSGNQRRADVAQIVQQQWRRIGVDARLQIVEFNTFIERQTSRNYEAVLAGWGVGLSADLQQLWGDPDLPFNVVWYDNAEVRSLMTQALAQPTEEMAAPYWRRAAALIVADQPYTWLYYFDEPVGVNERLQGILVNTLGRFQRMWEWHVVGAGSADAAPI